MSYCFDVMARAWARLRETLPPEVRDGARAARFEMLMEEMHEANHRLGDAVNHDAGVSRAARKLDNSQ